MKRLLAAGSICVFLFLGVIGCGGESTAEAKNMMDKGGVTVVDVRREEEYKTGHISEAVLLTNETIGNEPPALLPDKNAVILVYCRSGVRSRQASEKLIKLGYKKVFDMGGIKDWPYDVVT